MKFSELDAALRIYETAHDHCVLPGMFMVARIDGRNFTRLTKERHEFKAPYDPVFRDHMVATTEHLMRCGFRVTYGYTQSDEISLVLHRDEDAFGRKLRKLISILAAEASAKFSLLLGDLATFDCRIAQFPDLDRVVDYLRWRNEDAHRNALNAHCYWTLRRAGDSAREATKTLSGLSVAEKNEFLFTRAKINFNDLPAWQKRGIGLYWEAYAKDATNPTTGSPTTSERRRIVTNADLPMRDDYSAFVRSLVKDNLGSE